MYIGYIGSLKIQAAENTLVIDMMPKVIGLVVNCIFAYLSPPHLHARASHVPDGIRVRWGFRARPSPICFRYIYFLLPFVMPPWRYKHPVHIERRLDGDSVKSRPLPLKNAVCRLLTCCVPDHAVHSSMEVPLRYVQPPRGVRHGSDCPT